MEPNDMMALRDDSRNEEEVLNSCPSNFHQNDAMENVPESVDLITQREKVQQQILALEKYFDADGNSDVSSCSSLDGDSEDGDDDTLDNVSSLDAKHLKIQLEIKQLEEKLGLGTDHLSDDGGSSERAMSEENSDDEDFELPLNTETCLEMNLVYQEVVKEKLSELEKLLQDNKQQQRELEGHVHGSAASNPRVPSNNLFIGNFMKPYFKDKVTGLGPPANPEAKEKMISGTKPCDEKSIKRWEGWQKSLLISAVVQDTMKRLIQPKLSKMEYLRDKASKVEGTEKEMLQKQIQDLDMGIAKIRALSENDLMGERNDDHDWEKISNIDFEGKRKAEDLKQFWQNYLHPSVNKSSWKPDEIEKLKSIVEENQGHNWEEIAEQMGTNRTAFMCFQTHQRYIYKDFKKREWTKEEDDHLRHLVQKYRIGNFIPHTQISYFLDGRDASQVVYRWGQVLDPSIKKGPWSKDEDELLLKAVEKYGVPNWWRIRFDVPGRTDSQVRDRYLDCLSDDVKKGPWTREEVNMLIRAVNKYGVGKWAKIASEIPNRIDSQCLQKWKQINKRMIARRSFSNSSISHLLDSKRILTKQTREKRKKFRRSVKKKDEDSEDEEDEEEVPYIESDEEKKRLRRKEDKQAPESSESEEEEPIPPKPKYVHLPLSKWMPTPTDETTRTTGTLRFILVKSPDLVDPVQSSTQSVRPDFQLPAFYTVLDGSGQPVNRVKTQLYQTPKTRTYDEEMILVSQLDVKNFVRMVGASILKKRDKSRQNTGNAGSMQMSKLVNRGASGSGACKGPRKAARVPALLGRGESKSFCSQQQLKGAIASWMGSLLIPLPSSERQELEADVLRKRSAEVELSSTTVFWLFLKILHIDAAGCKKVISARKTPGPTGTHPSPGVSTSAAQPTVSMLIKQKQQSEKASVSSQVSHMQPQQHQQVLFQLQQPQQIQHPQPMQTQVVQVAQPLIAQQLQPCKKQQTQFPQMPQIFLMPVMPPQSTPSKPVSTPVSKPEGTRPSKRTRKPTTKAKELMEEAASNAKNHPQRKRPRLDKYVQQASPVAWIITPTVQMPVSTQDPSKLVGNSILTHSPAAGSTSSSPSTCTSSITQANIPVNMPGVPPGTIVFSLSNVPVPTPVMMPAGTMPNLVRASTPGTPVTTSSPSVQGRCSTASPAITYFTTSPLATSQALPSAPGTAAQRPPLLKTNPLFASPLAAPGQSPARLPPPITPVVTVPRHLVTLLPAPNRNQTPDSGNYYDPNLMFMEDVNTVQSWMKERSGAISQLDHPQPYIPPFVSSIKTLQSLMKARTSLFKDSLKVLPVNLREAASDEKSEEQLVAVRRLVKKKFDTNPAYVSLKARFLSCFAVPALLATIDPAKALPLTFDDLE
ncbi:snRNA-activating protein complex subunit 4 [Alosa sapidissima]|uniref:snRNA-activating protein complex subunit 4 n=1 Tax=Alosa sapidissima TaxID=34773 RepID=UPI001C09CA9A|nr:snRNA-activating protein complex subunit 4 [Alosa sapidissima]XP_041926414.1 snRNA-activating protein complex subunit 4 [Alosa sapidissima]XP_041926415.1 snRNA-activating protein complex subunit 4 [Alosa sapidissima]XP_041926416.1 snRNA-activating protein complex subunit 4 [Alosa sapidissima]